MVEIIEEGKGESKLPTLEELEVGTVIQFSSGAIGLVILGTGTVDSQCMQNNKALLLINDYKGADWFLVGMGYTKDAMVGKYKRIIGKLKKMVVE